MEKPEFPLNIIKEKLILSIPPNLQVENEAVIATSVALREFLMEFISKIEFDSKLTEKKIVIKDIKEMIESDPKYTFLQLLLESKDKDRDKDISK